MSTAWHCQEVLRAGDTLGRRKLESEGEWCEVMAELGCLRLQKKGFRKLDSGEERIGWLVKNCQQTEQLKTESHNLQMGIGHSIAYVFMDWRNYSVGAFRE